VDLHDDYVGKGKGRQVAFSVVAWREGCQRDEADGGGGAAGASGGIGCTGSEGSYTIIDT
jgi:hypothetical protein